MHPGLLAALALVAATAAGVARATDFGQVEFVSGDVQVITAEGQSFAPKVGDTVPEGAELVTGKDGELHIGTTDAGYVALRPSTRLRVTQYVAEGDDFDTEVLSLVRGGFRSISGWIGHHNAEHYKITTPTATIGIRGTDHEPTYLPPDDPDLSSGEDRQPGTYDKVNEGATYIENEAGRVDIDLNQAGFAPQTRLRPARLARIPRFFRATPNERRIVQRREALRRVIEQRRLRHRQDLKQRIEDVKARRRQDRERD